MHINYNEHTDGMFVVRGNGGRWEFDALWKALQKVDEELCKQKEKTNENRKTDNPQFLEAQGCGNEPLKD